MFIVVGKTGLRQKAGAGWSQYTQTLSTSSRFYNLLKQCHQLRIKYPNTGGAYAGDLSAIGATSNSGPLQEQCMLLTAEPSL